MSQIDKFVDEVKEKYSELFQENVLQIKYETEATGAVTGTSVSFMIQKNEDLTGQIAQKFGLDKGMSDEEAHKLDKEIRRLAESYDLNTRNHSDTDSKRQFYVNSFDRLE